jgi:iron complex outermembrane receptor protein
MFRMHPSAAAVAAALGALASGSAPSAFAQSSSAKPPVVLAQAATATLPSVVVTGNPLGSELFDLVSPISVLDGKPLLVNRASTLGELIADMPGVSSSYFGPNASRPIIRGLDGDRIRILQNGVGMIDASAASPDHAVAVDPLVIERVEVVRGPAALLYGGNAVGGVVNVLDSRIPMSPVSGFTGSLEGRAGGADRETGLGASMKGGNGRFALHADAYHRDTGNYRIPGFARSARARDPANNVTNGLNADGSEPRDTQPNSDARSNGGALGGALHFDKGYAGVSFARFDANYGAVGEQAVRIDMESSRVDLAGEVRDLGRVIKDVRVKFGRSDYTHREIDAGVVGTTFKNRGHDARIEAVHGKFGPLSGALGVQLTNFDFSALGGEAFVPQTATDAKALFLYEEVGLGAWKLSFGGRLERNSVKSEGGGANDPNTGNPRFGPAQQRDFGLQSGAFGAIYHFNAMFSVAGNLSYTERAPTYQELYAHGPHVATQAYEVGDPRLGKEKSKAFDMALRMRSGKHSGSIGYFVNRFDNYIGAFGTANRRNSDGELNPVDDGGGNSTLTGETLETQREFVYRAVPAEFRGLEASGKFRLLDRGHTLDLRVRYDRTRAHNRSNGDPIPRIPASRLGLGLDYGWGRFGARLDLIHAWAQDRVSVTERELPTDGYTIWNAALTCDVKAGPTSWTAFLRGINLTDREARNHSSFLKNIAPMPGRGVQVGLRGTF